MNNPANRKRNCTTQNNVYTSNVISNTTMVVVVPNVMRRSGSGDAGLPSSPMSSEHRNGHGRRTMVA